VASSIHSSGLHRAGAALDVLRAWLTHATANLLLALALLIAWIFILAWIAPDARAQSTARPAQKAPTMRDAGKIEFESRCASCHGVNGKGPGPVGELLRKSPPDLTLLAKRNSGVFPMARLYDSITGDALPAAHGTRDMPVWGRVYREDAATYYMELPYDPDAYTRAQVLMLLEYVHRLQQK